MLQQIIPVWVINLQKRPERLSKITKRLDELDIIWKRIDAIDGKKCNENLLSFSKKKGAIGELTKGARGCIESHIVFWQELISHGSEYGIVLEDDIELSDDFKNIVCDVSWIPPNSRIIKLEKLKPEKPSKLLLGKVILSTTDKERHIHRMYSKHCGSGAYLLKKEAANIALKWKESISVPIDHQLFNETVSKLASVLTPHIMVPPLAWQTYEFDSDIDYKLPINKLEKTLRSVKRAYYEIRLLPFQIWVLFFRDAKIITVNKK